jgi:hypothetical protein
LTRASLPRRGCARRFPTSLTTCSGESRIADRGGGGGGLELGIRNPRMLGGGRAGEDGRWGGGHEFGRRKQCVRARSRLVGDGEFRWWRYPCGTWNFFIYQQNARALLRATRTINRYSLRFPNRSRFGQDLSQTLMRI